MSNQPRMFTWTYPQVPKVIQIETTIICNAHCPFCPQNNTLRKPMVMDWSILEKIVTESRGWGVTYRPFVLNEPFADKRMPDIVDFIKQDTTAQVEFNTNGELLDESKADRILSAGVDVMRFSVDGIDRKTFDESRGINYDRVYKNVQQFLKMAAERKSPVDIEVRMIQFPGTEREQMEYRAFWESRGAKVVFTTLYRYPWEGQTEAVAKPCLKILKDMFFYVNGKATLCCWDSKERAVVGDIQQQSLLDIWNGVVINQYRDHLAYGQRDQILLCSRCDAYKDLDFSRVQAVGDDIVISADPSAQSEALGSSANPADGPSSSPHPMDYQ